MEKIPNPINVKVTFSKRRASAFKKASELCTLTGSEVAILTFSPSNKIHSFGHPNLQTVLSRFVNGNSNSLYQQGVNNQLCAPYHNPDIMKMNEDITEAEAQLDNLTKTNQEIEAKRSKNKMQLKTVLDQLDKKQLLQLYENLDILTQKMDAVDLSKKEANKGHVIGSQDHGTLHGNIGSSSMMNHNNAQIFTGGSSTTSFGQDHIQYGNCGYGQFGGYGSGGQSTLNAPDFTSESIALFTDGKFQSAHPWPSHNVVYGIGASNIPQAPFCEGSSTSLFGQQFHLDNLGSYGGQQFHLDNLGSYSGQHFHTDGSRSFGNQFNCDAQISFGQQFYSDNSFGQQFPSNTSFGQDFYSDHAGSGHAENFWTGVPSAFTDNAQPVLGGSSSHYDCVPVDANDVSEVIMSNASSFGGAYCANVSNHHVQQDDDPDFSALYSYLDNSGPKSPTPEFDNISWNG